MLGVTLFGTQPVCYGMIVFTDHVSVPRPDLRAPAMWVLVMRVEYVITARLEARLRFWFCGSSAVDWL